MKTCPEFEILKTNEKSCDVAEKEYSSANAKRIVTAEDFPAWMEKLDQKCKTSQWPETG